MTQLEARSCPKLPDAPRVLIYTDGGCSPNPGPGGWAAVLLSGDSQLEIAGPDPDTTNNRMEITAALQGLRALHEPSRVTLVTDSEYLYNSMTNWISGWSKKGFVRKPKPLKNVDLFRELAAEALRHECYWHWTRAHVGTLLNERCDELVGIARETRLEDDKQLAHCERGPIVPGAPSVDEIPTKPTAKIWV